MFSGDPVSWQTFWDSINAAVNLSPTLSAVQKFNYLRAQLKGDAARTIAGLPLTKSNYAQSVAIPSQRTFWSDTQAGECSYAGSPGTIWPNQ